MDEAASVASSTSAARFDRLAALIRDEIGVKLPPGKRLMVESRLRRRMRDRGFETLDQYLAYLFERNGLAEERESIFDAVTTNKTDFFREPAHYRFLAEHVVPAAKAGGRRPLKVWSAAASNGAEAWSAAMVLAAPDRGPEWAVLGTDINTVVLAQAQRAVYPVDQILPVPQHLRDRFVMEGTGEMAGECRIHPDLRRHVRFLRLNLTANDYPVDHDIDVIFLRNVLIYFEAEDQARVIAQLVGHLRPGGFLLVGHSESMVVREPGLSRIAAAVFQKG